MEKYLLIALRPQMKGSGASGLARWEAETLTVNVQGLNMGGVGSTSCTAYIIHRDGKVIASPLQRVPGGHTALMHTMGRVNAVAVAGLWNGTPTVLMLGAPAGEYLDPVRIKALVLGMFSRKAEPMPEKTSAPIPAPLIEPMSAPIPERMPEPVPAPMPEPITEPMPEELPQQAPAEEVPIPYPQGKLDKVPLSSYGKFNYETADSCPQCEAQAMARSTLISQNRSIYHENASNISQRYEEEPIYGLDEDIDFDENAGRYAQRVNDPQHVKGNIDELQYEGGVFEELGGNDNHLGVKRYVSSTYEGDPQVEKTLDEEDAQIMAHFNSDVVQTEESWEDKTARLIHRSAADDSIFPIRPMDRQPRAKPPATPQNRIPQLSPLPPLPQPTRPPASPQMPRPSIPPPSQQPPRPPSPPPMPRPPFPMVPTPIPIPVPANPGAAQSAPQPPACAQVPRRFFQGVPTGRLIVNTFPIEYPGADWLVYRFPSSGNYLRTRFRNPNVECFALPALPSAYPPPGIPMGARYMMARNGRGYWVFCSCPD